MFVSKDLHHMFFCHVCRIQCKPVVHISNHEHWMSPAKWAWYDEYHTLSVRVTAMLDTTGEIDFLFQSLDVVEKSGPMSEIYRNRSSA